MKITVLSLNKDETANLFILNHDPVSNNKFVQAADHVSTFLFILSIVQYGIPRTIVSNGCNFPENILYLRYNINILSSLPFETLIVDNVDFYFAVKLANGIYWLD